MNNCIGLLVPKIGRTTQNRFTAKVGIERGKAFDGVCPARSLQVRLYLTLSFIAKEFFMAQLVV